MGGDDICVPGIKVSSGFEQVIIILRRCGLNVLQAAAYLYSRTAVSSIRKRM